MRRWVLRWRSKRLADAEGLLEPPPPRQRDRHGLATRHPFHPAEIEVAPGERGPDRARDVWASLGPVEAEPARAAASRTKCGKLEPESGEKAVACRRDL